MRMRTQPRTRRLIAVGMWVAGLLVMAALGDAVAFVAYLSGSGLFGVMLITCGAATPLVAPDPAENDNHKWWLPG